MQEVAVDIRGLGILLYSPFAVAHIPEGADYLRRHFWTPDDVAQSVMECRLTTFCTGSPGRYRLQFLLGAPQASAVAAAAYKIRLGLEVNGGVIHIRDLYDLMEWSSECPSSQQVEVADGWYRLTVYSSAPASGLLGDDQVVCIALESVASKPLLRWTGVPSLC